MARLGSLINNGKKSSGGYGPGFREVQTRSLRQNGSTALRKLRRIMVKKILFTAIALLIVSNANADLKLYVFDCGHLSFSDVSNFGITNEETEVRELFVPCYLIDHPDGKMIWDAGLPLDIVGPRQQDATSWYENSIIDQLDAIGVSPQDIGYTAYSHFHYDHVGAANEFSAATLLIQETEYMAAFHDAESNPVFRPPLYSELINSTKVLLQGDHDVFGDGSVIIISAPGHTPGHQVLKLELENFGPLVLSGDLYHFEISRQLRRTPVFNTDAEETLRSMNRVEVLTQEAGATFWMEHSLELANSLNLAPYYYD